MRKEAALEEWRALYDIATKLKELKPWEKLYSLDLITIQEQNEEEAQYCSINGSNGEYYGIIVYNGVDGINKFFQMLNYEEMPYGQFLRYQNNLVCNFGDREELTTKERNIIKELGLKFRGRNNWIYFRRMEEGYYPYMPNQQEVIRLTNILNHLYNAIEALNNGLKVDFEHKKMLLHKFDEKSNKWVNSEEDLIIPELTYPIPVLTDELLMKRLKNKPCNNTVLELDAAYLQTEIRDKDFEKPVVPRLFILFDCSSEFILAHHMITPKDDVTSIVITNLIEYVNNYGRPEKIVVRDDYFNSILYDICEELEIEVMQSTFMYLDRVIMDFNERM